MNILEAKTEIANTLKAYHLRDDRGNYRIPVLHQRPILLMEWTFIVCQLYLNEAVF